MRAFALERIKDPLECLPVLQFLINEISRSVLSVSDWESVVKSAFALETGDVRSTALQLIFSSEQVMSLFSDESLQEMLEGILNLNGERVGLIFDHASVLSRFKPIVFRSMVWRALENLEYKTAASLIQQPGLFNYMSEGQDWWILKLLEDHINDDSDLARALSSNHIIQAISGHDWALFLGDCIQTGRMQTARALLGNSYLVASLSSEDRVDLTLRSFTRIKQLMDRGFWAQDESVSKVRNLALTLWHDSDQGAMVRILRDQVFRGRELLGPGEGHIPLSQRQLPEPRSRTSHLDVKNVVSASGSSSGRVKRPIHGRVPQLNGFRRPLLPAHLHF